MFRARSRTVGIALTTCLALLVSLASLPALGASEQGDTLSIAFESDIDSLDPAIAYDFVSWPAERLIFETLISYGEGTDLVAHLATEMPTVSSDGLTYTFSLRDDVWFVKDGEALRTMVADDVVHSLNRLLRPDLTPTPSPVGPQFFGTIEGAQAVLDGGAETATGIVALDDLTVEITLSRPDRTFLNSMALPFASVVPADIAGLDGDAFSGAPVGTGPFWLESWVAGERAMFRRNEHYWREGYPKAGAVDFRLLVTAQNQVLQAKADQLDIAGDQIPSSDYPGLSSDPRYSDQVVRGPIVANQYLTLDTSGPDSPFADPLVRQAVNHAIDKQNILRLSGGRGRVLHCIFPDGLPGFDSGCQPYAYDPERARTILDEAGVDGFETELYTAADELSVATAEAVKADLAVIGIEVEIVAQDWDTLLGTIDTPHAAPMLSIGWFQDFPDPSDFIEPLFGCASAGPGGTNWSHYCNEEVDAMAEEARTIMDLEEAIPMYQAIQRAIMADAPIVPLMVPEWTLMRSDRVRGYDTLHPVWFQDLASYGVDG